MSRPAEGSRPPEASSAVGRARLDHVVLAVRDLEPATAALVAAGLHHGGGGEHVGRGTANALFPLAEGYLELLTVTDPALARAHSPNRAQVADALDAHPVLPLGYALEVDDVAAAGEALERAGQPVTGPVDMVRRNAGGEVITWRNLYVGATQWRTVLPFLITWDAPEDLGAGPWPRLAGLDLAGPVGAAWPAYRLLGATRTDDGGFQVAGVTIRSVAEQGPDGQDGLVGIHLAGGESRGPVGGGLEPFLRWT